MPKGVYIRTKHWKVINRKPMTEDTKLKLSNSLKGIKRSEDTKRKMGLSKLGDNNPMKRSDVREKSSKSRIGVKLSDERRANMSEAHKGIRFSESHLQHLRHPKSDEHRKNISKSKLGEKNLAWKGGIDPEYYKRIAYREYKLKKVCSFCGVEGNGDIRISVHHVDGNHLNNEVDNLKILCGSCHTKLHIALREQEGKEKNRNVMAKEVAKGW